MPVPSSINDLSATPASNSPPGSESPSLTDDYLRTAMAFIAQLRDRTASGVAFTPAGNIAATSVQAAIAELDSEKASTSALPTSGNYTPTLTAVANCSGLAASFCQWLRVGNIVTVSGRVVFTASGAGTVQFRVSLPQASNFTTPGQLGGTGATDVPSSGLAWVFCVATDTTNDAANFSTVATGATGSVPVHFNFTYTVA